jgi:LSD1 subclass zinc finger protein
MTVRPDVPNPLIHKIDFGEGAEKNKAKTIFEQVLSDQEAMAAQRFSTANLEKMAIQAENEAAKLRGEPPMHKPFRGDEDEDEDEEYGELLTKRANKRKKVLDAARALIDSGVDPNVVARMMLNLPMDERAQQAAPQQTSSITELTEAMKNMNDIVESRVASMRPNGDDDRTRELISEMRQEQKELRNLVTKLLTEGMGGKREQIDPMTAATNAVKMIKTYNDAMKDYAEGFGYVKPGGETAPKGESIEALKERHRHDEEMAKLGIDKEYKTNLAETLADIPVAIGSGLARQMREGQESKQSIPGAEGLESHKCDSCGTMIIAPPGAKQVRCPKCGMTYGLEHDQPPSPPPQTSPQQEVAK